jgi:ABC-type branched-subunit amino acid transport system substrate-binding protein
MRRLGPIAAALALSLPAACAKRIVTVAGRQMSEDEAAVLAGTELSRTRAATAALPPEQAAREFEALAARLGDASGAADALFEAAARWRAAKRPERAAADLGQLLGRFPLWPRSLWAKYQLGLAQIELGRPRDAFQTLSTLHDKLPREEQLEAASRIADAAEAARLWPEAARWRAELATRAEGARRDEEVARLVEIVDGRLSFLEVAKLKEDLPSNSPALPAVVMKLARVYLHLHDYPQAEGAAREEAERWPGGPFAADARALLERLRRRTQTNPRTIGLALPMSGKFQAWGEAILQGVTLGLGEGSGFKIAVRDTRGEPDGAAQAIEELVAGEGAIAVLGGVANAEAPRAAAAAQELEVPFVSLSKVEGVTDAGPYVFRLMLTASAQARALAAFAFEKRGMRRFAIMWPGIPYGQELANAFWDEVDARGGEMRGAEPYDYDRTTFSPLVKDLVGKLYLDERLDYIGSQREIAKEEKDPYRRRKALEKLRKDLAPVVDFDALFIPDFAKNLALIAPALAVEDVVTTTCDPTELERIRKSTGREGLKPVQLLGANGWDDPSLVEKAGRYVTCSIFVDGFFPGSDRPETKRFVEAYAKKYGTPPSILEASAYDAVRMVRQALERDASPSRASLRDALAGVKGFKGATGDISFDERREPSKALFLLTIDKEGLRELRPSELAAPGAG